MQDFYQENQNQEKIPELLKQIQNLLCRLPRRKQNKCSIIYIDSEEDFLKNGNYVLEFIGEENKQPIKEEKQPELIIEILTTEQIRKKRKREIQCIWKAKNYQKNREEVLRKQREYYAKNREDQLKKILANRKIRKELKKKK